MARDDIYENMLMSEVAPPPKGNTSKTLTPWQYRTRGIVTAVLVLLMLALATSLLAVTLLYFRGQRKLQAVEEAVQKLRVSLQPNKTSAKSAKESDALQLLDEAQAGVRMLRDQLGNASAAYREIQTRLDRVTAVRATGPDPCGDVLTKLSKGWKFYSGNLYYFSQGSKSWEEAEQFCVSEDSHLTSISSQAEQDFLFTETKEANHWIGLTDQGTEGTWRWVDGTEFREEANSGDWESSQPDNWHQGVGGREDCVEIRRSKWNDANCTLPTRWICKQARGSTGL
ncbi:C-type lectin domain family 4 member F-like [Emydura macquarii macquarii]|uniref:C-type lectin domain family 4 member F-like n=1 Tax=Emydura macquarii macquarii TaxID=1129001 RepID=UPI00352AEFC6